MGQVGGGGDCSCRQVISWAKLVVEGTAPVGRSNAVPVDMLLLGVDHQDVQDRV